MAACASLLLEEDDRTSDFKRQIEDLRNEWDFVFEYNKITELLETDGQNILETDPEILMNMVGKAHILIKAPCNTYHNIIQKMADIYQNVPYKPSYGPLDCLVGQIQHQDHDLREHQEELMSLIQILLPADSVDSRTKCLRALIVNAKYVSWKDWVQWTEKFIDTIELLLTSGADPTWIPRQENRSVLNLFLHTTANVLTNVSHLAGRVLELIALFLTERYLNHREPKGTVLHALTNWNWYILPDNLPRDLFEQYYQMISSFVKANPALLDMTDDDGQTAVHVLAKFLFIHTNRKGLSTIFPLLISTTNVNILDRDFVTPYSWILMGKERWLSINAELYGMFLEVEKIFLQNGANPDIAKTNLLVTVYRWLSEEFRDESSTSMRLNKLVNFMRTVKNWEDQAYMLELYPDVWEHQWKSGNPKLIPIGMDIMRILAANESAVQYMWDSMISCRGRISVSLPGLEVLGLCAKNGAFSNGKLQEILSWTKAVTGSGKLTQAFLTILEHVEVDEVFNIDLNFLGSLYKVNDSIRQSAKQLMPALYGTENCLKLINVFLCISSWNSNMISLDESFFELSSWENWLQRSPLHLAAIFLDSEQSLSCLPDDIIKKYINARDIHGCTPLHVAYLHHNEKAISFLISHGALENVTDNFGKIPRSLASSVRSVASKDECQTHSEEHSTEHSEEHSEEYSEEHIDVKQHRLYCSVLETSSGVQEKMRRMITLPEEEAQALSDEFKMLFERLVQETKFSTADILIVGSTRERLKVGNLDEVDIQIRFDGVIEPLNFKTACIAGVEWSKEQLMAELTKNLIDRMSKVSWEGVHLRPVSVKGPWKFLREGSSVFMGTTISVDVVPVILLSEEERPPSISQTDQQRKQQEIMEGAPMHRQAEFSTLHTWIGDKKVFGPTTFAFEWDIIDSLPTSCRLAIAIGKALVMAYDCCRGDDLRVKMPITSYTIKTALFYIVASEVCGDLEFSESDEKEKYRGKVLMAALETVVDDFNQVETKPRKLKFNPNPKWLTDEDLVQHGEQARVKAMKIFTLIRCLAKQGWALISYWNRHKPVDKIRGFGETEYICDVCDCALERLDENTFYNGAPVVRLSTN